MIHFNELNAPKINSTALPTKASPSSIRFNPRNKPKTFLLMKEWDQQRREVGTYLALVYLRFTQNTADLQAKQAKDESDAMRPKLTELENNIKKALVQHPCRQELEQQIGSQMFSLWESEIPTFDPAIAEDLIEESGLSLNTPHSPHPQSLNLMVKHTTIRPSGNIVSIRIGNCVMVLRK